MSNDPVDGGTVTYHRADWYADEWSVWFTEDGPLHIFTAAEGEAMGLTPPDPEPLVIECRGHRIELSDEEARAFVQEWDLHGDREDFFMLSNHDLACDALAGLLRDARQDPQPVPEPVAELFAEQRERIAAKRDPQPTVDTPSDGIDFDALPIGTVIEGAVLGDVMLAVKMPSGDWYIGDDSTCNPSGTYAHEGPWEVVYQPAPLSPGECLRGLLAGRDDADELIECAAEAWHFHDRTDRVAAVLGAVGDAARLLGGGE